jgi:hypothetical protein
LDVVTEPERDHLRAADADREAIVGRLREAHGEGRLDLAEFDERAAQAWAARTYGDLTKLTADLPGGAVALPAATLQRSPARPSTPPAPAKPDGTGPGRAAVGAWLTVSLINVVIWGIVSLTSAHWVYPWWIWVAGPWGAVILAGYIGSRVARS